MYLGACVSGTVNKRQGRMENFDTPEVIAWDEAAGRRVQGG